MLPNKKMEQPAKESRLLVQPGGLLVNVNELLVQEYGLLDQVGGMLFLVSVLLVSETELLVQVSEFPAREGQQPSANTASHSPLLVHQLLTPATQSLYHWLTVISKPLLSLSHISDFGHKSRAIPCPLPSPPHHSSRASPGFQAFSLDTFSTSVLQVCLSHHPLQVIFVHPDFSFL